MKTKLLFLTALLTLTSTLFAAQTTQATGNALASTTASPLLTTFVVLDGNMKEQLRASKQDAVDFLADRTQTELLTSTLSALRETSAEFKDLSDLELTKLIVLSIE